MLLSNIIAVLKMVLYSSRCQFSGRRNNCWSVISIDGSCPLKSCDVFGIGAPQQKKNELKAVNMTIKNESVILTINGHRNNRRCIGDASPKVPLRFVKTSRVSFLVGPHVRHRHPSPPEHVIFIASALPEVLALVGP